MVFEVFRSLNSKADHLVNWDLVSLIHGGMDANQVLFLNHLVSDLRFFNCTYNYCRPTVNFIPNHQYIAQHFLHKSLHKYKLTDN